MTTREWEVGKGLQGDVEEGTGLQGFVEVCIVYKGL